MIFINILSENAVQQCIQLIDEAKCIAAFTGAGISTNAGIPDFRGPKGLYVTRRYDPDKVFDIHYFHQDPKPFYEFARDFVGLRKKIQPTVAHHFLSQLEESGQLKGIVTQNIDSLHQMAGSKNVLEMHGSFWVSYCTQCRKEFSYEAMKEKLFAQEVPTCSCGSIIKPDIVFFGENVKCLAESADLAGQVDLFFVIGTSCVVYPAAMIPEHVNGKIIVVNRDPVKIRDKDIALTVQEDIDSFFKKVSQCLNN